jgi:hypothetical protein
MEWYAHCYKYLVMTPWRKKLLLEICSDDSSISVQLNPHFGWWCYRKWRPSRDRKWYHNRRYVLRMPGFFPLFFYYSSTKCTRATGNDQKVMWSQEGSPWVRCVHAQPEVFVTWSGVIKRHVTPFDSLGRVGCAQALSEIAQYPIKRYP